MFLRNKREYYEHSLVQVEAWRFPIGSCVPYTSVHGLGDLTWPDLDEPGIADAVGIDTLKDERLRIWKAYIHYPYRPPPDIKDEAWLRLNSPYYIFDFRAIGQSFDPWRNSAIDGMATDIGWSEVFNLDLEYLIDIVDRRLDERDANFSDPHLYYSFYTTFIMVMGYEEWIDTWNECDNTWSIECVLDLQHKDFRKLVLAMGEEQKAK